MNKTNLFCPDEGLSNVLSFFTQSASDGLNNAARIKQRQKIIRRVATTDKGASYEASDTPAENGGLPSGVVVKDGKLIGFGINIFNEDVYPLQSFEIYLRGCGLAGDLDLTGCADMVFVDVYHNEIGSVRTGSLPSMRIFGVQDNRLTQLDVTGMPALQGVDAGMNRLTVLDVSQNPELVELYINDNDFTSVDLAHNSKLKYFYCHNNRITTLDTRKNPLLRHLNASGCPMKSIRALAPQREEPLPLEVYAGEGGTVGLKFNPVYNAQWKETGEWQQTYIAYPADGFAFEGWHDPDGIRVSTETVWVDDYGTSRVLKARFARL